MSDNAEQLVYQVSVDLGSSMNKVTDLRKGFEVSVKSSGVSPPKQKGQPSLADH